MSRRHMNVTHEIRQVHEWSHPLCVCHERIYQSFSLRSNQDYYTWRSTHASPELFRRSSFPGKLPTETSSQIFTDRLFPGVTVRQCLSSNPRTLRCCLSDYKAKNFTYEACFHRLLKQNTHRFFWEQNLQIALESVFKIMLLMLTGGGYFACEGVVGMSPRCKKQRRERVACLRWQVADKCFLLPNHLWKD